LSINGRIAGQRGAAHSVLAKTWWKYALFSTFTHVLQTCFAAFFKNFFNGFEISMKFAFFDSHIEFYRKKMFCSLNANAHETAQKNSKPFL
jgi:hypothetical protein